MAKILMTLESNFPHDERVEKEAFSLINQGHEVHILCYTKTNEQYFEIWNKIHIHRFQINKWLYKSSALCLQFPMYFNKWSKELLKLLKAHHIEIIHIHDLPLISVVLKLKAKFHFKAILDLHENWPVLMKMAAFSSKFPVNLFFSYSKWVKYELKWVKRADGVISVIEEAKERLIKIGANEEKTIVVSNTIHLDSFILPDKRQKSKTFSMLYSGGVNEHRGLQIVLQAISKAKESGIIINMNIVGGGNYMGVLKKLAMDLGISSQFNDIGWKSFQEMMEEIVSADLLIIPHLKSEHTDATIPNKLFQYMYVQKPLLVSNCNPLKRIVENENAGMVYKNDDANDLAKKLVMIHDNYEHYLDLSIQNKRKIEEKYNWRVEEDQLIKFYETLVKVPN